MLFDTAAAEITACEIHEVRGVTLAHEEVENPYFVQKGADGDIALVRNVITAIGPVGGPMISLEDGPARAGSRIGALTPNETRPGGQVRDQWRGEG